MTREEKRQELTKEYLELCVKFNDILDAQNKVIEKIFNEVALFKRGELVINRGERVYVGEPEMEIENGQIRIFHNTYKIKRDGTMSKVISDYREREEYLNKIV